MTDSHSTDETTRRIETDTPTDQSAHDRDRIDELKAENEALRERIAALEEAVEPASNGDLTDPEGDGDTNEASPPGTVPRRGVLALLTTLGLGSVATGNASAASGDHLGELWDGSPGTGRGLETVLREKGQALKGTAGTNTDDTNDIGVKGTTYSSRGIGLEGLAAADSGNTIGLKGRTDSPDGTALFGEARNSSPGSSLAVEGLSRSEDGTAIQGHAKATGDTVGVEGTVDSADGYGLATPDDAQIEGTVDTNETDFVVDAGTQSTGDAKNVIQGHTSNRATSGVVGGVVGGGGFDDGSTSRPNELAHDYGTVGGGRGNTASGEAATVAGGDDNAASGPRSSIAGGIANQTNGPKAFVGAGEGNVASDFNGVVAGGFKNTADAKATAIGGGAFNEVTARRGTVGGGVNNTVSGEKATVGGGQNNHAEAKWATIGGGGPSDTSSPHGTNNAVLDHYGTVGGGGDNLAGNFELVSDPTRAQFATVGGGEGNASTNGWATVPGGRGNTASGEYSFAAGRAATADHSGSFVWSDSGSSGFSSGDADQFLVDAAGGVGIGTDSPRAELDVDGAVAVSKTGVDAYLSSNQTIPNGTATRVEFDSVRTDDFDDFDTSTGVYTVQTAGDYHVDFLIDWVRFSSSDLQLNEWFTVEYFLAINGSKDGGLNTVITERENDFAAHSYSKTVFDLNPGDTIEVFVGQSSETDQSVEGSSDGPTYLTIHKVG